MIRNMVQRVPFSQRSAFVAATLVAFVPGLSWAGFEIAPPPVREPARVVEQPVVPPAQVAPFNADFVQGFGTDVPLGFAAMQIIPSDKTASFGPGVDANRKVSWQGGRPWRQVLGELIAPQGAVLRESGSMIVIEIPSSAGGVAPAPMAQAPSQQVTSVVAVEPVASPIAEPPPAPPPPTWEAKKGETLQEVLRRWCNEERVELRWAAEFDYPLGVNFRREGEFKIAVRDILRGFENARPRPVGKLHLNTEIGHPILLVETRGADFYGE